MGEELEEELCISLFGREREREEPVAVVCMREEQVALQPWCYPMTPVLTQDIANSSLVNTGVYGDSKSKTFKIVKVLPSPYPTHTRSKTPMS